ncbi:ribosome maturation factor RimP [Mucilaginibacter antarcticus]|uniref:ribosome maturation factor RimP n=1 Tax=Mucilaginibacter antarcticus TaxID=1855725 RepID=UPI00362A538B
MHLITNEGPFAPSFSLPIIPVDGISWKKESEKGYMNIEKRVVELVEEKIAEIERPDLFLVSAKLHSNGKLIILVDGDNGIGIAECVAISRYVGFKLEEENVIETAYNLEVSSPGIDMPLVQTRQYTKNIGRDLAIKLADGSKKKVP